VIGEYFEESKIGDWIYYYYPQKVKIEIEYEDNNNIGEKYLTITNELYSGDFTLLDNDKKIKEIRSIKNGLRNGNTEFIDINTGKRINKVKYKDGKIK